MLRRDQIVVPLLQQHGVCARNEFCFFETRRAAPSTRFGFPLAKSDAPVCATLSNIHFCASPWMKITESKKFCVYNFIVAPRRCQMMKKKRAFVLISTWCASALRARRDYYFVIRCFFSTCFSQEEHNGIGNGLVSWENCLWVLGKLEGVSYRSLKSSLIDLHQV